MEYLILAFVIFFVFFYKITEKFSSPVTLYNFGPCKTRDTNGNCIERHPINEFNGIELKKINERIKELNTHVTTFKNKVTSNLNTFKEDAKSKLTGCFGTKDGDKCEQYYDQTCKILGSAPCLSTRCAEYHKIRYPCGWGKTCTRNGACKRTECTRYGPRPCNVWNDLVCKTFNKVPTFNC